MADNIPVGRRGHFSLWLLAESVNGSSYYIYDERCPREHAHVVWSGSSGIAGIEAMSRLDRNPPTFLPCAPGVRIAEEG